MNKKQEKRFFALFDEKLPEFQWFIERYFAGVTLQTVLKLRKEEKSKELMSELISIWFMLPDNKFNIMENPPGWSDFLTLIEFE